MTKERSHGRWVTLCREAGSSILRADGGLKASQKASKKRPGPSFHKLAKPAQGKVSWVSNMAKSLARGPLLQIPQKQVLLDLERLSPSWASAQWQAELGGVSPLHRQCQLCALKLQDQNHLEQLSLTTASALLTFHLVVVPFFEAGLCYGWPSSLFHSRC